MAHIDLNSPAKRTKETEPVVYNYNFAGNIYLPSVSEIDNNSEKSFFHVIETRKSQREFGPLSLYNLSSILWYLARVKNTRLEENGYLWQHRNVPSAGGRHPIDILLCNVCLNQDALYLYDGISHSLKELLIPSCREFKNFKNNIQEVLDPKYGTILWFVAQPDRTLSKYSNGESLIWLDAGGVLASLYFIVEALELSGCAVGITGEPWVSKMFKTDLIRGTCGFIVGG